MKEYTIYCTEEQTKKAFKLDAPIEITIVDRSNPFNPNYGVVAPTAEQMLAWLEEQRCINFITISRNGDNWYYDINVKSNTDYLLNLYCNSRKEATLAAIDAALEYLIKNKK